MKWETPSETPNKITKPEPSKTQNTQAFSMKSTTPRTCLRRIWHWSTTRSRKSKGGWTEWEKGWENCTSHKGTKTVLKSNWPQKSQGWKANSQKPVSTKKNRPRSSTKSRKSKEHNSRPSNYWILSFRSEVELEAEASKLNDEINIVKSELDVVYQHFKAKRHEINFIRKDIAAIYEERKGEFNELPSSENVKEL